MKKKMFDSNKRRVCVSKKKGPSRVPKINELNVKLSEFRETSALICPSTSKLIGQSSEL